MRDAEALVESFLTDWDRHVWMADNGDWASSQWDEERETYTEAVKALELAVKSIPEADRVDGTFFSSPTFKIAYDAVVEAEKTLEDQVRPDESDYIAEGVIDPDNVEGTAKRLRVFKSWSGWECVEGWVALRNGDDLYLNWYRTAIGNLRHARDLYVLVEKDFFAEA